MLLAPKENHFPKSLEAATTTAMAHLLHDNCLEQNLFLSIHVECHVCANTAANCLLGFTSVLSLPFIIIFKNGDS